MSLHQEQPQDHHQPRLSVHEAKFPNTSMTYNDDDSTRSNSNSRAHCFERLSDMSILCEGEAHNHAIMAKRTKTYHNRITVPAIIFSAIGSAVAYIPVGDHSTTQSNPYVAVCIAVISTVNMIFVGLINYFKWDIASSLHTEAAKQYTLLSGEIKSYIVAMPTERNTWLNDLSSFRKKKEDIVKNAPII